MSRHLSYLRSAKEILNRYKGEEPFASFLKRFFSANKKYGSTDRKNIAHLCYCYFRLGRAENWPGVEERILAAAFLCSNQPNEIITALRPEWSGKEMSALDEKLDTVGGRETIEHIFPWKEELSRDIEPGLLNRSFLIQPDLFLRIRPGYETRVKKKLNEAGIGFKTVTDQCLALANSSKVDGVVELNREAVVQDYSSQKVGEFMKIAAHREIRDAKPGASLKVWDCCSGSGGKSIMAVDGGGSIDLTVSDIRESILVNLKKRFREAGIERYRSLVMDLTRNERKDIPSGFDLILADVPCTGSGTWSRTPEQLFYFDPGKIEPYADTQIKIISRINPSLKEGGYLLYITCSVFKKENEEVAEYIRSVFFLEPVKTGLIKGYDQGADTLFVSLFRKPL